MSSLTKALVTEIIHGVMSPDVERVQATLERHFHPAVHFMHHLAEVHGRANLAKCYRADHAFFDIKINVVDVGIDHDKLLAFAWVNQEVRLRLPGPLPSLFSPRHCPVVTRLTFQRTQGQLLVVEQYDHVSTYYLPSLLGPWAEWAYHRLFLPCSGLVCGWASDLLDTTARLLGQVWPQGPNVLTHDMRGFAALSGGKYASAATRMT